MPTSGLKIGIVADDMTGANDTALPFFLRGAETGIMLNMETAAETVDPDSGIRVWSVNTHTRHDDPNIAEGKVRHAVSVLKNRFEVDLFYKKIDSTLRGNLAHECLGFLDELEGDCVVVVPAYPEEKRLTVGGYQLMNSQPIEKTNIARDPLCPVRTSHIPTLLEQSTSENIVGYIGLAKVLQGAAAILKELSELVSNGNKLVVMDATSAEDLDQIALALEKIQKTHKVLPCGSAGLANALAKNWLKGLEAEEDPAPLEQLTELCDQPVLIVNGSNSNLSRSQTRYLIENHQFYCEKSKLQVFDLNPEKLLGLVPIDADIESIVSALKEKHNVVVTSALKEDNYAKTINLAKEHNLSSEAASRKVEKLLSQLTEAVSKQVSVPLVLTGGETAAAICQSLGLQSLKILACAETSVPLMEPLPKHFSDNIQTVVTKSGSFGNEATLVNTMQYLLQMESTVAHA